MDRRFNQRISSDLPVRLTQLDDGVELSGQVQDISDSGICGLFNQPLAPGVLVKLEILGLTLYGDIVYSNPEDDVFRTGIFVEPALLDSSNITELVKSYLVGASGRS
ncbi:MAG: PilZ domain-containing protein [Bryobacteraceae bacterium]